MSVHELFDVSVLFDSAEAARGAFLEVFGTTEASATIAGTELTGLASCSDEAMPLEHLDLRFVGPDYDLGVGYVGLKLGIMDQFSLHQMRTDDEGVVQVPDVWGPEGRMREATLLLLRLLDLGGHAVLLHKASAALKPAEMFQTEAGDLTPERGERPFLAWLDVMASQGEDGRAGDCRSYGMPHYFGEPNVRTIVPHDDQFSVERAMQALKYTCGLMAAGGLSGRVLPEVEVPLWYLPGRNEPEGFPADAAHYTWTAEFKDSGLLLEYRVSELPTKHPWVGWSSGKPLHFDIYTKAFSDFLLADIAPWGMSQIDAITYDATDERPEVCVLLHDNGELYFYATAGLGRIDTPNGRAAIGTLNAELCLFSETEDSLLESVLLNLGTVLHTTPVETGVGDWDTLPPQSGFGFLFVPMNDNGLGNESRPLAMRMLVPLSEAEYTAMQDAEDRAEWYRGTIGEPPAVAARWSAFCEHFGG